MHSSVSLDSQPSHWGMLASVPTFTGSPCRMPSTYRLVVSCPPLAVTAATAMRRLSGENSMRRGVPSALVRFQLSVCSMAAL